VLSLPAIIPKTTQASPTDFTHQHDHHTDDQRQPAYEPIGLDLKRGVGQDSVSKELPHLGGIQ
jgi:hypothetical protein